MNEHHQPTEAATSGKLFNFWRGLLIGLRDYPRYIQSHFTMNRKARRTEVATSGKGRHNAKVRPTYSGWWNGCHRVARGAAA